MRTAEIVVPATSANLGPGFDCLGLALDIVSTVRVELTPEDPTVEMSAISGESDPTIHPRHNLLCQGYQRWGQEAGRDLPGARFTVESAIPVGRGLGASAAAIVAGLAAGAFATEDQKSRDTLVRLSTEMEGHPDNCVAAILGGMTAAFSEGSHVHALNVANHLLLGVSLFIPDEPLLTTEARAVLPATVPMADATFDLGRLAYLTTALIWGRWEAIGPAMEDRLHQPYRERLIPALPAVIQAARTAGAYGASLSGGGPSVIALGPIDRAEAVAAAMEECARENSWPGRVMVTQVRDRGVSIKALPSEGRAAENVPLE